jgi:hypothetical protein
MTALDHLVWVVEGSYVFGEAEVGIRTTSREFGRWVDRALDPYRISKEAAPVYSIVIADGAGESGLAKERYHILYRQTVAIARTPDIQALVQTFRADLETFLFPDRDDAIFAEMNVVSLDGVNALIPAVVVPFIGTLGRRRLARTGLTLPADTAVAIEAGSGHVIPVQPQVQLEEGSIDLLAEAVPGNGREQRAVVDRPTKIDVVLSVGWGLEPFVPVSRGIGLHRLGTHVLNIDALGGPAIEGLLPLVEGARCIEMAAAKPPDMLDALLKILQPA